MGFQETPSKPALPLPIKLYLNPSNDFLLGMRCPPPNRLDLNQVRRWHRQSGPLLSIQQPNIRSALRNVLREPKQRRPPQRYYYER